MEGPILITPAVHGDERGFFVETYRASALAEIKNELSDEHMVDLVLTIAFYCAVVRVLATMKMDNEPYYKEVLQQYPIPGVK